MPFIGLNFDDNTIEPMYYHLDNKETPPDTGEGNIKVNNPYMAYGYHRKVYE